MRGILTDLNDPDRLYVATFDGGVYTSADAGEHWSPRNQGLDALGVAELAQDPLAPNQLYAATGDGLYRSLDAGTTWSLVPGPLSSVNITSVSAVSDEVQTVVYCGVVGSMGAVVQIASLSEIHPLASTRNAGSGVYQTILRHGPTPVRWLANFGAQAGGWTSQDKYPRHVADVNGDGKADAVGFGNAGVYVSLSTGKSFASPTRWIAAYGYSAGGWISQNTYPRFLADVNGDGKADVVGFFKDGVYVSLSTGSKFGTATRWIAGYGSSAGGWTSQDKYPRFLADVNGDGKADVIGVGNAGAYVSLSTGAKFGTATRWIAAFGYSAGGWTSQDKYPRTVADVNGDGKADVVGFGNSGVYVSRSTGASFLASSRWIANFGYSAGGWTSQNLYPRMLADLNADSRADIVGFSNAGTYISLSTGSKFGTPTLWTTSFGRSAAAGSWTSQNSYPRTVGDVNHDHKADIVGFGGSGVYVLLFQ